MLDAKANDTYVIYRDQEKLVRAYPNGTIVDDVVKKAKERAVQIFKSNLIKLIQKNGWELSSAQESRVNSESALEKLDAWMQCAIG